MRWWPWTRVRRAVFDRDPDLDLVKHMTEQHEFRLQQLEREAEQIAGVVRTTYRGLERRRLPRN